MIICISHVTRTELLLYCMTHTELLLNITHVTHIELLLYCMTHVTHTELLLYCMTHVTHTELLTGLYAEYSTVGVFDTPTHNALNIYTDDRSCRHIDSHVIRKFKYFFAVYNILEECKHCLGRA